ncbi:MAG TPA: hypothetical protein DCF63_19910 [Planctomycetaceae bacterium]|nr:hypothetical protein [Planctomycetaceae bacterium]
MAQLSCTIQSLFGNYQPRSGSMTDLSDSTKFNLPIDRSSGKGSIKGPADGPINQPFDGPTDGSSDGTDDNASTRTNSSPATDTPSDTYPEKSAGKSADPDRSLLQDGVLWDQLAAGRFQPRKVLGRGGFAMVYQAYDSRLRREVALKIPHFTSLADQSALHWLRREGLASASLQHPHLVHLYDFEVNGQNSFLVLELIEGHSLAGWIEQHPDGCDPRMAAELVMLLAEALQHAHSKSVLHRDIKPSNILLDMRTKAGALPFSPRLADFGLAIAPTQETLTGATGGLMGSLHYLPPEIVKGNSAEYSIQSDIYALAVVLREMLTGKRLATGSNVSQVLQQIAEGQFDDSAMTHSRVPRDLWAICVQAMDINPQRRYASAQLMADDLQRFLQGRPVLARVPGVVERTWRWARRNPTLSTSMILFGVAITSIVSLVVLHDLKLSATLRDLQAAQSHNEQIIYAQDMAQASDLLQKDDIRGVRSILARYSPDQPQRKQVDQDYQLLSKSIQSYTSKQLWTAPNALYTGRFSPDGQELFVAGAGSEITQLDPNTANVVRQWDAGQDEINYILIGHNVIWSTSDDGSVCAWRFKDNQLLWRTQVFEGDVEAHDLILLKQLDQLVVLGSNDHLRVLSAQDGKLLNDLSAREGKQSALANLHDGRHFLFGNTRSAIYQVDGQTMQVVAELPIGTEKHPRVPNEAIRAIEVSSDGKWATIITRNERVYLVDLVNWSVTDSLDSPDQPRVIQFLDSSVGAASGESHRLWLITKPGLIQEMSITTDGVFLPRDSWVTHGQRVFHSMQNSNTQEVLTLDAQGGVQIWSQRNSDWNVHFPFTKNHWFSFLTVDSDRGIDFQGKQASHELFVFNGQKGIEILSRNHPDVLIDRQFPSAALCEVGQAELWAVNEPEQTRIISWHTLSQALDKAPPKDSFSEVELPWQVRTLPFRADEIQDASRIYRMVSSDSGHWIAAWDSQAECVWCMQPNQPESVKTSQSQEVTLVWFEPQSHNCWWVSRHLEIYRWNLDDDTDPQLATKLENHPCKDLAISPDKTLLAIMHDDASCLLWDLNRNRRHSELIHAERCLDVTFSPSGKTLMVLGERGGLTCWNIASGRKTFEQEYATENIYGGFSRDSRKLIRSIVGPVKKGVQRYQGWKIESLELGSGE